LTIIPNKSYIYDISLAIEKTLDVHNLNPILDLTGHGIGKKLHEYPYVPCFVEDIRENTLKIIPGMAIAVEVMYTFGKPDLIKASDGWTIKTKDGKIAGLFEDTVIVTENGYQIIT
jgi:methionyl aminopeptidase